MSLLRSLLVHVDHTPRCALRLQLAAELARRHGAEVHGLLADGQGGGDTAYAYTAGAASAQHLQDEELMRRAAARAAFDEAMAGVPARWSEMQADSAARVLARLGTCADLLLMSREPAHSGGLPGDLAETVILDSGRPALVLPARGGPWSAPEVAVVAWQPTPESTRALRGALPLLQHARRVEVVSWGEDPVPGLGHADVEGHLRAHGVQVSMHRERHVPRDLGHALLAACRDAGAGLLVMGCYGHSRARERWLGGATRGVLQAMDLPVLMAH